MKTSVASLVLASLVALSGASTIKSADMPRFLMDKNALVQELEAWKQSEAGQYAKDHGLFVEKKGILSDDDRAAQLEDQLQRFFVAKLLVEEAHRENPDAVFSTDSPFTLMTDDEFTKFVGASYARGTASDIFHGITNVNPLANATNDVTPIAPLAQEKDWTTSGCVAEIKNQGQCGSCWAFAAISALESAYCISGKPLTTFSEQQLTSCDSGSGGCQGGFPGDGLRFIQQAGSVCREADYPYTSGDSGDSGQCQAESCSPVNVAISQVASVPETEAGLLSAVDGRPVAVGVAAGNRTWKQYKSGVVSTCASSQLDHAVLVVGYGGADATPFFKIRNSWGSAWGESGYIRLKRGVAGAGTCGIIGPKSVYPVL
ncbi:hypothetical protein Poli38472_000017 [Pythium oligandrum]|uniref:Peptidase C1A papain C-terminal domain-containing protein n=1 Tax=Pythium oligandrum TaxID=41045 RepID=A0A8K1CBW6_PYTOL|nr:hypothetical protein Poli38472_000017 [Pythium oligandrum]|eukprot:TMW59975.1 hypothetical protein Poli38472_000017 [Pythium oligandrum]